MKITKRAGLWYATIKCEDGQVLMGYSPVRKQAMVFCFELLEAKHDSVK